MAMRIGIIGLPQVGKRTLFELLTGVALEEGTVHSETSLGIAQVRDPRLTTLAQMFEPEKVVPAEFEFSLFPDLQPGQAVPANWLANLREMESICHVVRGFEDPSVFHVQETVNPGRDLESVQTDLVLTDLITAEKRLERLQKDLKKGGDRKIQQEADLMGRCIKVLEEGQPLTSLGLSEEEAKSIRGFSFLSLKPLLIVYNSDSPEGLDASTLPAGTEMVFINAREELEIASLDSEEERKEFMESLGLEEPAIDRLSRQAFHLLGLISFFTVGKDEVRAWPVPRGASAPQAAGAIHSDFERGFIRAEIILYDQLIAAGSEQKAKALGHANLKGKDYEVQDGDVIHFRFNV